MSSDNQILQLTSVPHGFTEQLSVQAETISELIQQRTLILRQREEEHDGWVAEREGWQRSAKALLLKQRSLADSASLEEVSALYRM